MEEEISDSRSCYRMTRHSWFTQRAFTINKQHNIWDRESGLNRYNKQGCLPVLTHEQEFYRSIVPGLSVSNAGYGLGFIRKFTPDGKMLISFSLQKDALWVFKYKGVGSVQNSLRSCYEEVVDCDLDIDPDLAQDLFNFHLAIPIITEQYSRWTLNREFSIFLENGRYVLLAARCYINYISVPREYYLKYPDIHDDTEIFDYTFFLVDLKEGIVSDTYKIRDYVSLNNNYGVSAVGNLIAITSYCRQCIDILEVHNGKLVSLCQLNKEQETMRREQLNHELHTNGVPEPPMKGILSPLKQQCISHLYKEANACNCCERKERLLKFYKDFPLYEEVKLAKSQFINKETLLMRFEMPRNTSTDTGSEQPSRDTMYFKLYVFYSLSELKVLRIFQHDSKELLHLQRDFYESLRNVRSWHTGRPASSPSNSIYYRFKHDTCIKHCANDPATEYNIKLPLCVDCTSCSPYLNFDVFLYDDRLISPTETPKYMSNRPITFMDRLTSAVNYRIHLDTSQLSNSKRNHLVSFVFHPYEPFFISVQQVFGSIDRSILVNFHMYCTTTKVSQKKDFKSATNDKRQRLL
ncbi:unnamed protein product [Ceratitis capitata]|uniref:(Mediterranean fruit fly) hypothetical protein n=2 Tax=Ceratitis capitata TaxID=7213 RepID=W8B1H0_CERCA|nr:unnamed protein product [Ceratitis capitata]